MAHPPARPIAKSAASREGQSCAPACSLRHLRRAGDLTPDGAVHRHHPVAHRGQKVPHERAVEPAEPHGHAAENHHQHDDLQGHPHEIAKQEHHESQYEQQDYRSSQEYRNRFVHRAAFNRNDLQSQV